MGETNIIVVNASGDETIVKTEIFSTGIYSLDPS